ncbi:nucleotidyl transferase AbiEii/AbiGii toxin family protein [bacterium]|nr:MAG: nucleotidyl transferase AbiEii/AbiGii toxin family protein [bacterium]
MIKPNSFSKEWIDYLRSKKKKIDPSLCEKMIRALGLLEQLVVNELEFVFKGGTSLILLMEKPQRFSIDIDINVQESKENLIEILDQINSTSLFKYYKEKKRKERGVPKAHFYFYYNSVVNNRENYIMLDVLFDEHTYPEIVKTPIRAIWIDTDDDIQYVKTPSIDSILGDKLTVFAPHTTGIKYGIGKSMEMIKQLFDIWRLFDRVEDMEVVTTSFKNIAARELKFRKLDKTYVDVLRDIIDTCLIVSHFPGGTEKDSAEVKELWSGMERFKGFPIDISYRADDAVLSASRAAYLAVKILNEDYSKIERFAGKIRYEEADFPENYQHLRKIKRRLPEAYFYWCKTLEQLHNSS